MLVNKPHLIIIDEIETHQHFKALTEICRYLLRHMSKDAIQLFVSTHSLDAIKILLATSKEAKLDSAIHQFMVEDGRLEARTVPGLDAEAIMELQGPKGEIRNIDEYA